MKVITKQSFLGSSIVDISDDLRSCEAVGGGGSFDSYVRHQIEEVGNLGSTLVFDLVSIEKQILNGVVGNKD